MEVVAVSNWKRQLHSNESMHVIVVFSVSLNVLINFDNEKTFVLLRQETQELFLMERQATWTYEDKSIVDHAKAICSRNFFYVL